MGNGREHLAKALHWSQDVEVEMAEVLASGIGMTVPIVFAAALGQLPLGLTASVGALAVAGVRPGSSPKVQLQGLISAFLVAVAASIAAALVVGNGWLTDVLVVLLACVAATIGGYSRPMVTAMMRFVLFLIIISNVAQALANPAWLFFLIVAGALWASFLSLLLGTWLCVHRRNDPGAAATSTATAAQKFTRWTRSLSHLSGWQYTFRLGLCLSAAGVFQWLWPDHHLYWIAVTVAILSQRKVEAFPTKATQRAIGTALGVLAAGLLLAFQLPVWGLILAIGLLAGARPVLKSRNYLVYSAGITLLIILIIDVGQPLGSGVLADRLLATAIGVALVIAANRIIRTGGRCPASCRVEAPPHQQGSDPEDQAHHASDRICNRKARYHGENS